MKIYVLTSFTHWIQYPHRSELLGAIRGLLGGFMSCTRGFGQSWFRLLSFAALATLIFCSSVSAQVSTTGKIAGVVTDASGAALATASITVKSPALTADRTQSAQADGSYLFDLLPPGTYEMTVSAQGFQ